MCSVHEQPRKGKGWHWTQKKGLSPISSFVTFFFLLSANKLCWVFSQRFWMERNKWLLLDLWIGYWPVRNETELDHCIVQCGIVLERDPIFCWKLNKLITKFWFFPQIAHWKKTILNISNQGVFKLWEFLKHDIMQMRCYEHKNLRNMKRFFSGCTRIDQCQPSFPDQNASQSFSTFVSNLGEQMVIRLFQLESSHPVSSPSKWILKHQAVALAAKADIDLRTEKH